MAAPPLERRHRHPPSSRNRRISAVPQYYWHIRLLCGAAELPLPRPDAPSSLILDYASRPKRYFNRSARLGITPNLRKALQALPLQELRIYFQEGFTCSRQEYGLLLQLGDAHPELRELYIGREKSRSATRFTSGGYVHRSVPLVRQTAPPQVGSFGEVIIRVPQPALEVLPPISSVLIDFGRIGPESDMSETIKALIAGIGQYLPGLTICSGDLRDQFWRDLHGFSNLINLTINGGMRSSAAFELADMHHTTLEIIHAYTVDLPIITAILKQARRRDLLPKLKCIDICYNTTRFHSWEEQPARQFLIAYDELASADIDVSISPEGIRERVARMLQTLERNGEITETEDSDY